MRSDALVAVLVACALAAGCKRREEAPPTPLGMTEERPDLVPAAEIQRGKDVCAGYVERACACAKTVPAAAQVCELAKGEPEAIRISLEVSRSPDSVRKDVIDAQHNLRKIVKVCVEEMAKLPALGCPP